MICEWKPGRSISGLFGFILVSQSCVIRVLWDHSCITILCYLASFGLFLYHDVALPGFVWIHSCLIMLFYLASLGSFLYHDVILPGFFWFILVP